jgi:hypothetical protein
LKPTSNSTNPAFRPTSKPTVPTESPSPKLTNFTISAEYQSHLISKRLQDNPTNPNTFQPGDFILFEYPRQQDKLNPPWHGPYEVIKHTSNDIDCRHLVQGNVAKLHVSTVKLFVGTKEEAFEAAKRDHDQFTILRIHAYRGDSLIRTSCQFEITFENLVTQWENWSIPLSQTLPFEDFCLSRHELSPLLYSQAVAAQRIRELNVVDLSTIINLDDIVYVDLRSYGSAWYQQLQLPDADYKSYVVPYRYVQWYHRLRRTKVIAHCQLFDEKHTLSGSWIHF